MKFYKIKYILIFFLLSVVYEGAIYAQQLPFYSQYRNNIFMLNPAIAGTNQNIDVRANYRTQWVGYDGAPTTSTISFHSRLCKGMLGLGGFAVKDAIGPNQQTNYNLSCAYHIRFPDVELSLGAAGYLTQYSLNGNQMTLHNTQDPSINQGIVTTAWTKNAGVGIYLYNDRFNIGLSALNYLQPEIKVFTEDTTKHGIVKDIVQANFIFGYNYIPNENYMCENNFYVNYVAGAPILLDYTFRFHYKKKLVLGASIRLKDALVGHLGYTIMKNFQVNYSYDFLISKLQNYSGGTHEITLIYSYNLSVIKNRFLKQKYNYLF